MSERTTPLLDAFQRDGYVIIQNLITSHLLLALQAACKYQTERARNGKWPYVRTVPKQYPPWQLWKPGDNIWGVQHLLHPNMPTRDVFAELYFSDEIINVVKELMGLAIDDATDDQLVMELLNLLISPANNQDFDLCWHRDDVKPDVSGEEETAQLAQKTPGGRQLHAQYNVALFDDTSLVVIPGSHRRPRTDIERYADSFTHCLPDQLLVELKPGDAIFYDSNILHRGTYKGIDVSKTLGRMTLHGSVGLAGYGNGRARQVLQHSVGDWVNEAHSPLQGRKDTRAEAMRKKLIAMGSGKDLGYSLDG